MTPGSNEQGPGLRAGGAQQPARRAQAHCERPGELGERVSAERVCAFQRVRGPARSCAFRARAGVPVALQASRKLAGVRKASRTHQVQSRAPTERGRERNCELRRHGGSRREPRRARSAGDPPERTATVPLPPPKKKPGAGGWSSLVRKKEPTTFCKEKQNPTESQFCFPSP